MSMNLKDKLKAEKWKPQQLGILEQWSEQKWPVLQNLTYFNKTSNKICISTKKMCHDYLTDAFCVLLSKIAMSVFLGIINNASVQTRNEPNLRTRRT